MVSLKQNNEILWNKPPNASQIVTCLFTNKGNFNFSQHFIICVRLCTVLPNIINSKCCVCLAVSVFLGNGIKPSQRHLPSKMRVTSFLTCAGTKSMVLILFVQFFRSSEIPMITLAFMESKLAYSVGRIETLSKIFQHPVSENISGVSFDELLSKSLILCAKEKVLFVYR